MRILFTTLFCITCFSYCDAQVNPPETISNLLYSLKDYIKDWSCDPYLEGSFKENLEISLSEGKLILKSNFTIKDAEFFGFPEYVNAVIDLATINSISVQQNDEGCSGIIIKTASGGISLISKYRNSNLEIPMPKENEFREKHGWVNDAIRIKRNEHFTERCNSVIQALTKIAIYYGNTSLQGSKPSNGNIQNTSLTGTGFAITSNGYIVTNSHIIHGAKHIAVRGVNNDFSKLYSAKVVVEDVNNDLAIIKIDDVSFKSFGGIPFTITSKTSDVGCSVYTLGFPLKALMGDEIKLTNGIISSRSGFQDDVTSYQISVPLQPGNSGGPLFDASGKLIGVVNAKLTIGENVSYAIKSSYLINLLDLLVPKPTLQKISLLKGKPLTEQVKLIKKYIYSIEVN